MSWAASCARRCWSPGCAAGRAAMTAREALALGTLHGARCLGRADEIGTLEPGKLADIVLWRLDDLDHAGHRRPGRGARPRRAAAACDRCSSAGASWCEDGELLTGDEEEIAARARRGGARRLRHDATSHRTDPRRDRRVRPAAGRHPEGQGRVRLLVGHVGRGHAVGRDAALARTRARGSVDRASARRSPCRACTRCSPTRTSRGARRTGSSTTTSPCWRSRRSATRASRWRSSPPTIPRPRAARPTRIEVDYEVLEPLDRPGVRARRRTRRRCTRPATCCATCAIEHGDARGEADVVVSGDYEVGMQDQAFLGPESGLAMPGRGRRRRPVHLHPVAARRPRPGRRQPRPAGRQGADHARRCRRRVRRARGPLDAGPRVPARAAHGQAGEDDLRARGVVLRPRPPSPRADALRARRDARRPAGLHPCRILLDGGAYNKTQLSK